MKKFKELKKNIYTNKAGKFDYKKFSDDRKKHPEKFIAGLEESRYGDAMSSRLPSHLEDPRIEPKKKKVAKQDKPLKESVWESYRYRALTEETEREAASHANRMSPHVIPHSESDEQIKKEHAEREKDKDKMKPLQEAYKVGDRVIPKIGPHKGQVHSVIHVHPTGHLNIKPEVHVSRNRYHLGAAKADPKDVTKHLEESTLIAGREEKPLEKTTGWLKNRGNQFHKWPAGVKLHNVNPLTSRKTVREAFEAAKNKKVKANDFDKPKDLKSKNDQDPQQAEVQAEPPQFGGKDNGAQEKKDNTPKPEKKGNKLVVKGPGVDDKFQPDPIVTPLTTLPDTASPKSGSQGVR